MEKNGKKTRTVNIKNFIIVQIILITTLFVIFSYSFVNFYKSAKNDSLTIGQETVRDISQKLNSFFSERMELLLGASESVNFLVNSGTKNEQILEFLTQLSENYEKRTNRSNTGIYGYINGEYLDGSGWIPDEGYDPKLRDWYAAAKSGDGSIVTVNPYLDEETKKIVITICRLLDDKKSVIAVDFSVNEIQNFANSIDLNSEYDTFVIDSDGLIISHTMESEVGKNYFLRGGKSEERKLAEKIFEIKRGQFEINFRDQRCFVLAENVFSDWYVVMLINNQALMRRIRGSVLYTMIGLFLVFVIMIYICTTNFKANYTASKYAKILEKYKIDLEHQLIEQWNQLDKKTHALVQMQESVIEGMATIIEYRDVNTGMHVQNTKRYVLMLTKYLYDHHLHPEEVNEHFLSMIGNAAAMHDIGKIAVSDEILNAPRKLTPQEFEIMKTHTVVGAGLVRQVFGNSIDEDMLRMCVDVVQYHHEKWNGKGYPIGLAGNDIPLCARIMAIADVFDAISSKRVYKDAVAVDEVFEIIKKDSGSHFDPELVEIFLGMKDDIKAYLAEITNKIINVKNADSTLTFDKIEGVPIEELK